MSDAAMLDRRQLFTLLGGAVAGLSAQQLQAAPWGIDSRLSRGYTQTDFGLVHRWTIGQGPTLVMLHQSAQTATEFAAIAPLLSGQLQVVALDFPNHGQSDASDHEMTMDEYAQSVLAVLDDLGVVKAHVLGQHGGATVAINLALNHPERIAKLILSGAGRGEVIDMEKVMNTPMTRDLPIDAAGEWLAKTWEVYRSMSARSTPPEITFQPFLNSLLQRQRKYDMHYAAYRYDFLPLLSALTQPTLLLEAEEDVFAGDVAALQARIPGSVHKKVPACGSWQFFEQPEANADIIVDFLS